MTRLVHVQKFVVSLIGVVANALAAGLLPDPWVPYAVAIVSLATATGVYVAPYVPRPPQIIVPPSDLLR